MCFRKKSLSEEYVIERLKMLELENQHLREDRDFWDNYINDALKDFNIKANKDGTIDIYYNDLVITRFPKQEPFKEDKLIMLIKWKGKRK